MINIRKAEIQDLAKLADIYARAFSGMHPQEKWTANDAKRFLATLLQRQPDLAFLAADREKIVGGFFAAIRPWWDGNHLVDGELFVDPTVQRAGIGKTLMKHMLQQAVKTYQITIIEAITFKDQDFPLNWYLKAGFKTADNMVIINGQVRDLSF